MEPKSSIELGGGVWAPSGSSKHRDNWGGQIATGNWEALDRSLNVERREHARTARNIKGGNAKVKGEIGKLSKAGTIIKAYCSG